MRGPRDQVPALPAQLLIHWLYLFKDAVLATDHLGSQVVDLIFLDIHLPWLKGRAFLKTLLHPPALIIHTTYHQYAVEVFDLNVTD